MKKLFCAFLLLIITLTIVSCSSGDAQPDLLPFVDIMTAEELVATELD